MQCSGSKACPPRGPLTAPAGRPRAAVGCCSLPKNTFLFSLGGQFSNVNRTTLFSLPRRLDRLDLGTAGYLDEVTGKVISGKDIRGGK